MVAVGRGPWCGTSAACARSLLSRRARAATAAAAHVQRVMQRCSESAERRSSSYCGFADDSLWQTTRLRHAGGAASAERSWACHRSAGCGRQRLHDERLAIMLPARAPWTPPTVSSAIVRGMAGSATATSRGLAVIRAIGSYRRCVSRRLMDPALAIMSASELRGVLAAPMRSAALSAAELHNKHMVAVGRGPWCGTSAACARSLLSRRARAATAAAAHVQRVMRLRRDESASAECSGRLHDPRAGCRSGSTFHALARRAVA